MPKRVNRVLALILLLGAPAFADSACPYLPSNADVINLASSAESLLRGLEDSKQQCGQAFVDAVKSVNSLGNVLMKLDDLALSQRAEREAVLQEMAKCAARPDCADMDYLADHAVQLDSEILKLEKLRALQNQDDSKKDAVALTSNLLAAMKTASQNSECRDYLSQHYAGPIAQTGLGMLSVASPLLFSSGSATSVGVVASLVSDLVDLLNSMPPKALREFEEGRKTLEMACLYHAIMSTSCEMRDNLLRPADFDRAKTRLESQAQCIPNSGVFNEYLNGEKLAADIKKITLAIAAADVDSVASSSGSGTNEWKRFSQQFGYDNSGGDTKLREHLQLLEQVYPKLQECIIDRPACLEAMDTEQRTSFDQVLFNFSDYWRYYKLYPADKIVKFTEPNGPAIPPIEVFKGNYQVFSRALSKRMSEVMGGGDKQDYRSLNSMTRIHTQVPLAQLQKKTAYLSQFLNRVRGINPSEFSAASEEWGNLKASVDNAQGLLSALTQWAKLDRASFKSEKEFNDALMERSGVIREMIRGRAIGQTDRALETAIDEMIRDPLAKLQSLWQTPELSAGASSSRDNGPFGNPFEEPKGLTPFERFSLLREVHENLKNSLFEANDQYYLGMTRRLFEKSGIGASFKDGLENMIKKQSTDPDPEVSGHMVRELCGLASSIGGQKTVDNKRQHPIEACRKWLPRGMSGPQDECSYIQYYREKIREDQERFGRKLRLPASVESAR